MGYDDLVKLVGIWERWTDNDPLLRRAVQSMGRVSTSHAQIEDHLLDRLDSLAHRDHADDTTVAALSAGWAVLLALDDAVHGATCERLRRSALNAHRDALLHAARDPLQG